MNIPNYIRGVIVIAAFLAISAVFGPIFG